MSDYLQISRVSKSYREHKAIDDVSFGVKQGEVFGLLGPNGAGKSTLIRMINQIIRPDEGKIFFEGQELCPNQVSRVGYLPEERGLYKRMSVGEVILYLAGLKGLKLSQAKKNMDYWLEKFDINDWRNKKVEQLSKGMQQKVQFITTVIHSPQLLIFDEPFSGFDPLNADLLKKEILSLKDNGCTILFSTHNMESVEEICEDIVLISKGKNILQGSINEIKQRFKKNLFLLSCSAEIDEILPDEITILSKNKPEDSLFDYCLQIPEGRNSEMLSRVLGVARILSYREILPSMNEIFIQTVNSNNQ